MKTSTSAVTTSSLRAATLFVVVAPALAALAGCGLHGKPHVQRKAEASRQTVAIALGAGNGGSPGTDAAREVVAPGIVEPWGQQVDLAAEEPGWIADILVKEGDVVRAGQVVATLDDAEQRHALDLVRADAAVADAALRKMVAGATPEEMRQAEAELAAASARATFSRAAAARMSSLGRSGTVPRNDADRALSEASAETALANRAAARLAELKRGARAEDVDAARASAVASHARVAVAEAALLRRRVIAPRPGTILLSRFHVGEYYAPAAGALVVIGDMSRLQVRLEVDEVDAVDVRAGAPCALYSDGGRRLTDGRIYRLAPQMGRRGLPLESPTARADVRVREVFVEIPTSAPVVPGQRVWGRTPITSRTES